MDKIQFANIFNGLPETKTQDEILETLLQNKHVKLERIITTGQTTPEDIWFDQETDEWVILLKGKATLRFENRDDVNLNEGDYVFIKAHQKHRVSWTHPDETCVWLAIHCGV